MQWSLYANEPCDEHAAYFWRWLKGRPMKITFSISGNDVISPESRPLNFHVFIHAYSLWTADVFPVVASLSSPIFRGERSDYWKCIYCSLAWVPEAFHVWFPVLIKSSKVTRFAGHVFSLQPNTCRPAADKTKLPVAREKKPLVPRVTVCRLTSA